MSHVTQGAIVNALDVNGSTPLHDAAAGGFFDICEHLLGAHATATVS